MFGLWFWRHRWRVQIIIIVGPNGLKQITPRCVGIIRGPDSGQFLSGCFRLLAFWGLHMSVFKVSSKLTTFSWSINWEKSLISKICSRSPQNSGTGHDQIRKSAQLIKILPIWKNSLCSMCAYVIIWSVSFFLSTIFT